MIKLQDVKSNHTISTLINQSNGYLEALGYTDHGPRHVGYVSRITSDILQKLDYDERTVELAAIAGWVHDIGNFVNRKNHAQSGAIILFPILREIGMEDAEVVRICTAVGNHDEETGMPVSEITAALIISDKIDAHRARVRRGKYNFYDIHDRVNYSIRKTAVRVDKENKIIGYSCAMDDSSSPKELLEIYMSRMTMAEGAAAYLGCRFELKINGATLNAAPVMPDILPGGTPRLPENGNGDGDA
jgi:metal-dependent HD superfamily phosphatase/phosphodiesterase